MLVYPIFLKEDTMNFEGKIGATPMAALLPNLFVKIEYTNMTGSVKDRAALEMILMGEKQGLLRPGSVIVEPTSGNTGISLAAIAAQRGYRCIIVMPDSMSPERREHIASYGAEVVLTPGSGGMQLAVDTAQKMLKEIPNSWSPCQFENPANSQAHYRTTGPEIWEQAEGRVDVFVAGVGTGGTLTGVGRYLKEKNPTVRIVAVEPLDSPLLSKGVAGPHGIQGIGANFVPKVLDRTLIDEIIPVCLPEAIAAAKHLAGEGYPCGISGGANVAVARKIALECPEQKVVTLLPDGADRYRSTGLLE
jgi:cysteine synthase A